MALKLFMIFMAAASAQAAVLDECVGGSCPASGSPDSQGLLQTKTKVNDETMPLHTDADAKDEDAAFAFEVYAVALDDDTKQEDPNTKQVIATQLAEAGVQELRDSFKLIDGNGDGLVTTAELKQSLKKARSKNIPHDVQQLVDTDGSVVIDYTEFLGEKVAKSEPAASPGSSSTPEKKTRCTSGQTQQGISYLFTSSDNTRESCESRCKATNGCLGFDYTTKGGSDACRGVSHGIDAARLLHPGEDNREFCSVSSKVSTWEALLFAFPMLLMNVSNYSTLITVPAKYHTVIPHEFGNFDSDESLLFDNVHGLLFVMQHALDDGEIHCPFNDFSVIFNCIQRALCKIQDDVFGRQDMKRYALYEEIFVRFGDVTWPMIEKALGKENGTAMTEGHTTANDHACDGSAQWLDDVSHLQTNAKDNTSDSSIKAAAYHTSIALVDVAKTTHAVLDSHTHNSSVDGTVAALHAAWGPACKLLNCDHTNYWDLLGASHTHSVALIEAGASARHMQVHIRSRARLELRMQRFLGEYGMSFMEKIYRTEGTTTEAQASQYISQCRAAVMDFVTELPKTHGVNADWLAAGSRESMKAFFENRGESHLYDMLWGSRQALVLLSEDEDERDEQDEQEDVLEEDEVGGNRRRRRRRRHGGVIKKIVKGVTTAVTVVVKVTTVAVNAVGNLAKSIGEGVQNAANKLAEGVKAAAKYVKYAANKVGEYATHAAEQVKNGVLDAAKIVVAAAKDAVEAVGNAVRVIGAAVVEIAKAIGDAVMSAIKWLKMLFECLGKWSSMVATGYGMTLSEKVFHSGIGFSLTIGFGMTKAQDGVQTLADMFEGKLVTGVKITLGFIAGFVPGGPSTGGLRTGMGITGGITCGKTDCKLEIAVGIAASAVGPGFNCFAGIEPVPGVIKCMTTAGFTISLVCCDLDLITHEESCR